MKDSTSAYGTETEVNTRLHAIEVNRNIERLRCQNSKFAAGFVGPCGPSLRAGGQFCPFQDNFAASIALQSTF